MAKVAEDAVLSVGPGRAGRTEVAASRAQAGAGVQALLQTDPDPSEPQEDVTDSRKDGRTASPARREAAKRMARGCAREARPQADPGALRVRGAQGCDGAVPREPRAFPKEQKGPSTARFCGAPGQAVPTLHTTAPRKGVRGSSPPPVPRQGSAGLITASRSPALMPGRRLAAHAAPRGQPRP